MDLPHEYHQLVADGFDFAPWHLTETDEAAALRAEYRRETGEDILPFARRQDCDDMAGFRVENGKATPQIITVHLTWSGQREADGFPLRKRSSDLADWLDNIARPASKEWVESET